MNKRSRPPEEPKDEYSLQHIVEELRATGQLKPPNPIFSRVSPVKYVPKNPVCDKRPGRRVLKKTSARTKQNTSHISRIQKKKSEGSRPPLTAGINSPKDEYSLQHIVEELRATGQLKPPNPIFRKVSPVKYVPKNPVRDKRPGREEFIVRKMKAHEEKAESILDMARKGKVNDALKPEPSGRGLHTTQEDTSDEEIIVKRTRKKGRRFA